jgi:hypothetical protein
VAAAGVPETAVAGRALGDGHPGESEKPEAGNTTSEQE